MKIQEIIKEFIPCEVCGNRDINNFYLHVFVHNGSQPYIKCCECNEEFYSETAKEIITRVENSRKARKERTDPGLKKENDEFYIGLTEIDQHKKIERPAWSIY